MLAGFVVRETGHERDEVVRDARLVREDITQGGVRRQNMVVQNKRIPQDRPQRRIPCDATNRKTRLSSKITKFTYH